MYTKISMPVFKVNNLNYTWIQAAASFGYMPTLQATDLYSYLRLLCHLQHIRRIFDHLVVEKALLERSDKVSKITKKNYDTR